jgi:hypothetical protein
MATPVTPASTDVAAKLNAEATAAAAPKKNKELPAMAAPIVNLPIEIRKTIAQFCRDNNLSFPKETIKLWLAKLVAEKKITQAFADGIDLSVKRGGGYSKAIVEGKDNEIAQLKALIASMKKEKGIA